MREMRRRRPAFTLLELMISIGILGVGLIMVATVFPVALSQHRNATDATMAQRIAARAFGTLRARPSSDALFIPPPNAPMPPQLQWLAADPLPWPSVNWFPIASEVLRVSPQTTNAWFGAPDSAPFLSDGIRRALYYYNQLAGFPVPPVPAATPPPFPLSSATNGFTNTLLISRRDAMDPAAPFNDVGRELKTRYTWFGFYSTGQPPAPTDKYGARMASPPRFAVAVCRSASQQEFAAQTFTDQQANPPSPAPAVPYATPYDDYKFAVAFPPASFTSRFPLPWRVEIARAPQPDVATTPSTDTLVFGDYIASAAGYGIGNLAPIGAKLFDAETGQVYTVARVGSLDAAGQFNVSDTPAGSGQFHALEVREPASTFPAHMRIRTTVPPRGDTFTFQVYVFPPAFVQFGTGARFITESPVLDFFVE